ncbi:MAG: hypothetical protein JRN39_02975 [Nitrososphaerota archaeon]|nr:hypothetical protein [Nitrososphaerota archaeon]MDG6939345.1 hypothetical protein [Nitrososphaerota archaeon]
MPVKKNVTKTRARRRMLATDRRIGKPCKKGYRRRSLAETAASTVKRRFDHAPYSTTRRRAQKNELGLKVLTARSCKAPGAVRLRQPDGGAIASGPDGVLRRSGSQGTKARTGGGSPRMDIGRVCSGVQPPRRARNA